MEQPVPLHTGTGRTGEPVQCEQLVLVYNRLAHATGIGDSAHSRVDTNGRRHLVVLHAHHGLLVHGQLGRLPHHPDPGLPLFRRRRAPGPECHQIRRQSRRIDAELLQGIEKRNLPENVELHGGQLPRCDAQDKRRRCQSSQQQRGLRLSNGVQLYSI
uniref:Uncharacterized protein n=1 Tax=Cacopsylla melanoneura TaxID=428564 RepID=A0A8D9EFH9_9HEMI